MAKTLKSLVLVSALLSSGCLIDTDGLKQVVKELQTLEAQASGDAKDRIEQLRRSVEGLLNQAEGGIIRVKEETLKDLIKYRKETILQGLNAAEQVLRKARNVSQDGVVPFQAMSGDMERLARDVPEEVMFKFLSVILQLDVNKMLINNDRLVIAKGLVLRMQSEGSYHLSFLAKNPKTLRLKLADTGIAPAYSEGACVIFKVPVSILAPKFAEVDSDSILNNKLPFRLVEVAPEGGHEKERHQGDLVMLPNFHVKYELTITDRKGRKRQVTINDGDAILELAKGIRNKLDAQKTNAAKIADAHGRLYELAKTHLPYGYSEIVLSPDDDDWSLWVRIAGKSTVLNQQQIDTAGVRVKTTTVRTLSGAETKKLMVYVEPVKP